MISERTLKNIAIKDLKTFCTDYKVPGRDVKTQASSTVLKYGKYRDLFENELTKDKPVFDAEELDEFLFNYLYYVKHDVHYIYQFTSDLNVLQMDGEAIANHFYENHILQYNQSLIDWDEANRNIIDLCTIRSEFGDQGYVRTLNLLLKVGVVSHDELGMTNFFCGLKLNFETGILVIKCYSDQMKDYSKSRNAQSMNVVDIVLNSIQGSAFECLGITVNELNEENAQSVIYKLYAELSSEAEAFLDKEMGIGPEQQIHQFLQNLKVSKSNDDYDDYVEQIKAVVYQDISKKIGSARFKSGWVFKFRFREGDHSKASSSADKRQAVYSCKAFWQLKELIHGIEKLEDGGFHWNMNNIAGDEEFVDVRMESKNGTLIVYYYLVTKSKRKEKEEYVLQKISGHL